MTFQTTDLEMPLPPSQIIAQGMLRANTPIEDHRERYGLFVKREDLACLPPGPPFSKTRGVYARVKSRPEEVIGVLDTSHSQAGHAVARACQILGKKCVNFYPVYKADEGKDLREPQKRSQALGAELFGLPAGRSCILYHEAKKRTEALSGYMMPNALKLEESVTETAKETPRTMPYDQVILPASSGTIAAGVIKGLGAGPNYFIHLGYSRSHKEVVTYLQAMSGVPDAELTIIDENYSYKDVARPGETPPWPCNEHYDLKAFRWWMQYRERHGDLKRTLFWNVG